MKNTRRFFICIALVLIAGFLFIGCVEMDPRVGTVEISGSGNIGSTLTASSRGGGFSGNHGYEWGSASSPGSTSFNRINNGVSGSDGSQLTITSTSLVGTYITARRWNDRDGAYVYSKSLGPITN